MKRRHLVLVLGDQLDRQSSVFDGFDREQDAVLQMEVREEAAYVPQHKLRIAYFFASMRHFRDMLREDRIEVFYTEIGDPQNRGAFDGEIARHISELSPEKLIVAQPGDWRVQQTIIACAEKNAVQLEIREDRHFLCPPNVFSEYAETHRGLLLESFYRGERRRLDILMDGAEPEGGRWNFDAENRAALPKRVEVPPPPRFVSDTSTHAVIDTVDRLFADSPGKIENFNLPVTRAQALQALDHFIEHQLENFGRYEDAMKAGQPFLFHSRLSGPLNLHLITPKEVVGRVIEAFEKDGFPLNSVEGFVRQLIGWREFVRAIYWKYMPGLADMNTLEASLPVPRFMWTGDTDMQCVRQAVEQLVAHAYVHHIQRLMVLGQLMLLMGVRPYDVHRWHMSMFWDAIDWVSLPNTLGMSQYGDGGIVGTKPYCASGRYIDRMSDYCGACRYDPAKATGDDACPFTTLYWDFLARHKPRLSRNRRMGYQFQNLARKDPDEIRAIRHRADRLKAAFTAKTFL